MILLDSSAIVEIIRGTSNGKEILDKLKGEVFVSPFSIYEIFLGLKQNENILLERLLNTSQILNFDVGSAMSSAHIMDTLTKKGQKINIIDIFIASIALSNNLTLVSLDKDFTKIDNLKTLIF